MEDLKIRVVGDPRQTEGLLELLKDVSKTWGKRKIFQIRKYKRQNGAKSIYNRSFGNAEFIYYIKMKIPVVGGPDKLKRVNGNLKGLALKER